jgi:hypothetical protein
MSDLSTLDQSFSLPSTIGMMPMLADPSSLYGAPLSNDVQPHEVSFRQLRGAGEIGRIVHLRNEIALSSAVRSDAGFGTREKKETK